MYVTTRLPSRTWRADAVPLRVYSQSADKIAGEQEDRDHCKNAGTLALFYRVTGGNALCITATIWLGTRIGIEEAVAQ